MSFIFLASYESLMLSDIYIKKIAFVKTSRLIHIISKVIKPISESRVFRKSIAGNHVDDS